MPAAERIARRERRFWLAKVMQTTAAIGFPVVLLFTLIFAPMATWAVPVACFASVVLGAMNRLGRIWRPEDHGTYVLRRGKREPRRILKKEDPLDLP